MPASGTRGGPPHGRPGASDSRGDGRGLIDAIVAMREPEALALASAQLEAGGDPLEILGLCREAMEIVGHRFEEGAFFIPELVMAGEILAGITTLLKPHLSRGDAIARERRGVVVLGSVRGDMHDIGKNIVAFMLEVNGYEVRDLGVDVAPERFVQAIGDDGSVDVVALSGFLTLAFEAMKATVEAIAQVGQRDRVRIMIGGGQIDETIRRYTGADAYGSNAIRAVRLCEQWIPEVRA